MPHFRSRPTWGRGYAFLSAEPAALTATDVPLAVARDALVVAGLNGAEEGLAGHTAGSLEWCSASVLIADVAQPQSQHFPYVVAIQVQLGLRHL